MKRVICSILAFIFITLNILPSVNVFADDGYTDSQLADIGTIMLSNLITSGEATEIDFSDYTESDGLDFLIALGELAVTGDTTGLIEFGLDWLGGELSDAYDNFIWSIREWEHDIAPDLYDFWYNGGPYEINIQKNANFTKPLRDLLTPRGEDDNIPVPPIDYASYINIINGDSGNGLDFYWKNYNINGGSFLTIPQSITSVSYCLPTNNWSQTSSSIVSDYFTSKFIISDLITFNINSQPNSDLYSITMSGYNPYNYNNWVFTFQKAMWKTANQSILYYGDYVNNNTFNNYWVYQYSSFSNKSLIDCLTYLSYNFRNVNIYVDGVPWAIVSSNTPTYPIVIPNTLTIFNDQPLQYTFPDPTYLDIPNLKTLITNAINNSTVIKWDDIDDYFVDVNGTPSLPVIHMIRNDYDNMYMEQYPYPATIIGFKDPLKFNEHLLDNSTGYLSPVVKVVENTVDVLPMDIVGVLGIGAILTIFALIINRLLE